MEILQLLNAELEKGFTKTDLEQLIGLPKNSLSSTLKNKRVISTISKLKIEKYLNGDKPTVLEYAAIKGGRKANTTISLLKEVGKRMNIDFVASNSQNVDNKAQKPTNEPQKEKQGLNEAKIELKEVSSIPQMPVREEGEDSFDYAARKNEWKKLYNQ